MKFSPSKASSATAWPQPDGRSGSKTDAQFDCCSVVKIKADSSQPNLLGASAQA
jgi:hypothetical protein